MKWCLLVTAALACLAIAPGATPGNAQSAAAKPWLSGWYDGEELFYYDFGANSTLASRDTVTTAPVYVIISGKDETGAPEAVPGQQNILDVQPGDPGYTDLWDVTFVTVPRDYEPNTLRFAQDIRDAGYPIEPTGNLVNCPIVPPGTSTEGGEPLTEGWEDGERITYFDFGPSANTIAPVWMFMYGLDAQGYPRLVPGQRYVFDSTPEDDDYTAFRRIHLVTVPEDYDPDSIRSGEEIAASKYEVSETDTVLNLPIVRFTPEAGEEPVSPAAGGSSYGGGGFARSYTLLTVVLGVMTLGAAAGGAAFVFALRRKQRHERAVYSLQRHLPE